MARLLPRRYVDTRYGLPPLLRYDMLRARVVIAPTYRCCGDTPARFDMPRGADAGCL